MIAITAPTLSTKNQVTKASGRPAGTRYGCRRALTISSRTNPTIQNNVCRSSSSKSEPSGHSAAQMITTLDFSEPTQAQHQKPRQDQDREQLGEAIEAEIAGPREDRRIDRGDDRIKSGDRSSERYAGGEVDGAPQHCQGQGSGAEHDDQPFLQRRFVAVGRIEADASGQGDETFGVIGNPAEPPTTLCPILFHSRRPWAGTFRRKLSPARFI